MKVLVIFSDPPGDGRFRLRLDREDRLIASLAKKYTETVSVGRMHASNIDDIHSIIVDDSFDVVQFSGHGSPDGIYLDRTDLSDKGELVSARRLQSLLSIAPKPPLLAVLLSCYSNESLSILSEIAPFVVSAVGEVDDAACLEFIRALYERLFSGFSIKKAFDDAVQVLASKQMRTDSFVLSRRQLIRKGGSRFVESTPDARRNSILINLDLVADRLPDFGMPEEEIYQLLCKKMTIHYWIFDVPRDRCTIPIGRLLFGEFRWHDASDVVYCTKLMRLSPNVSSRHWQLWNKLLISYNDLASCRYRTLEFPGDPVNRTIVGQAVKLLDHYVKRYILPSREEIGQLGFTDWLPNVEFVISHSEAALDQFELERYPQTIKCLEEALTNFHEIVDGLQPPEEGP